MNDDKDRIRKLGAELPPSEIELKIKRDFVSIYNYIHTGTYIYIYTLCMWHSL